MQDVKILSVEVKKGCDGCPEEVVVDLTTPDGDSLPNDRYGAIKGLSELGWELKGIEPLHYTNGILDQEVLIFTKPKNRA